MASVYTTESGVLNSSVPSLVSQTSGLETEIAGINKGVNGLQDNLSVLSMSLFQLQQGVNQTSQLVYGIQLALSWPGSGPRTSGIRNPYTANSVANASLYKATNNFGGNPVSIGYYNAFFDAWNATFATLPNSTTPVARETGRDPSGGLRSYQRPHSLLDANTKQLMTSVASGLNVSNWNQTNCNSNLTITGLRLQPPSSAVSFSRREFSEPLRDVVHVRTLPAAAALSNTTVSLFKANLGKNSSSSAGNPGFTISQLVTSAKNLGQNYSFSQAWNLAAAFAANATQAIFSDSPLFHVNSTSLQQVLASLPNGTTAEIRMRSLVL